LGDRVVTWSFRETAYYATYFKKFRDHLQSGMIPTVM